MMRARPTVCRSVLVALSACLALAAAAPAHAGDLPKKGASKAESADDAKGSSVDAAEDAYAKLDYDTANKAAKEAIETGHLSHDELVRAQRVLAVSHAVLDRGDEARQAFIDLLGFDPEFKVDPNLGPKVTTPFFEARGFWRGQSKQPGVEVKVEGRVSTGGSLVIAIRDPRHIVKAAELGYRWGPSGEFQKKKLATNGSSTIDFAGAPGTETRLDYYISATDDRENVVLAAGAPSAPKNHIFEAAAGGSGGPQAPKEKKSVLGSPVFWGVTGGVVAAAAGTVLFFALQPAAQPDAATMSPALYCGGERCN